MIAIHSYLRTLSFGSVLLVMIAAPVLTSCDSSYGTYATYDESVRLALKKVNYEDGISKEEAESIANAYLYLHGRYKGRSLIARIHEAETEEGERKWAGKLYALKSMASPVTLDLKPVVIDKRSGEASWQHGPTMARIELAELDKVEPVRALQ